MALLERVYTIPLRREWLKAQRYKRSKKAVAGLVKFLVRHMKSDSVLIGENLNRFIWRHGIRNPPSRVKVSVTKDDKGVVKAELFGFVPKVSEEKVVKTEEKPEVKEIPKEPVQNEVKPVEPVNKKRVVKKVASEDKN